MNTAISLPFGDIYQAISDFESLNYSWDGYGGHPLHPAAAQNARNFVSLLGNLIDKITDVYPNPNGTVTIEFEKGDESKLSIEIGKENYSYFVIQDNSPDILRSSQDICADFTLFKSDFATLFPG